MPLHRRRFLSLATSAISLPAIARTASADAYPSHPVHLMVGFPPGGGVDIHARLIGDWLSNHLKQPFVIENRGGASGNIATEVVIRSPADGYTLLQAFSTNAINATLYHHLNYNFIADTAPVACLTRGLLVMVVNPSFPAKTVPDFISYAKSNPNKVIMASAGIGTPAHVAGELFKQMTGVNMLHVPYRGDAAALTAVLANEAQVTFAGTASVAYVKTGSLRGLAVASAARSDALPDTPTIGSFVPGYEAATWFGIVAPKNTPVDIIELLNKQINAGLENSKLKARFANVGATVLPGSPHDFRKLIAEDTAKWAKVIQLAGAKAD